ncbi:MAG: hypothetical protein HGB30_02880 [Holophagaceae bacterium]|nr:hypothetical protein [Holophagaceae bacterium]
MASPPDALEFPVLEPALRTLALCLALAGVETLHGLARMRFLVPRIGMKRAQRISIVTGSLLALLVCSVGVPGLGLHSRTSLLGLGLVLAAFMAAFDMLIGRLVARRSWKVVLQDFDPRRGNLLVFGLLVLLLAPLLVMGLIR